MPPFEQAVLDLPREVHDVAGEVLREGNITWENLSGPVAVHVPLKTGQ